MNGFDAGILSFFNQFARVSRKLDASILFLSGNHLFKGFIFAVLLWWIWFKKNENNSHVQKQVISIQLGCLIAIMVGRLLALTLPFRTRPIQNQYLDFIKPYGVSENMLKGWSSFPSDHAVMFFAMIAGLFLVSKRIGQFALIYTILVIAIPRIYLGLHYPSDIVAGAVVGISIGWLVTKYFSKSKYCSSIIKFSETKPQYFYPLFFLITFQIAHMFGSARQLLSKLYYLPMVM